MKHAKRLLCLVLTLCLAFSFTFPAAAASSDDITGHWAEDTLREWAADGLLTGDGNGIYRPNASVSRAEFFTFVNKWKGYTKESDAIGQYTDVSPDQWYYKAVAIALEAGYASGTSAVAMSPGAPITREQAMTIVAKISELDTAGDTAVLAKASDGTAVSAWAKGFVAAVVNEGLISGSGGKLNPVSNITRAESVVLLNQVRAEARTYAFAGTYGPSEGVKNVGSITVAAPDVVIQNMAVTGDLTIAKSVGEGDAHINNVSVGGDAYILGGGKASLYMADFRVGGSMIVRKYEGENTVRIVVSGASNFSAVVLQTGAILVTQELADGTKIPVEIPANYLEGSQFEFVGDFDQIVNNGADANIIVTGAVNTLTLNGSATVSGTGTISVAEISENAGEGSSFATKPTSMTGAGSGDVTIGSASPAPAASGGGGGGGGGSGNNPPASADKTVASVEPLTVTKEQGETYTLPVRVTAKLSDGTSHEFAVAWSPGTASTANVGTFHFTGALTMTSGYVNPGNQITASLTLIVKPVLTELRVTLPAKVLYFTGEDLDLTGMVVTGLYSDGSEAAETQYEVSGYDQTKTGGQTVTITVGKQSASFTVTVYEKITSGTLISIVDPQSVTVANGAAKTAAGLNLPPQVEIIVKISDESGGGGGGSGRPNEPEPANPESAEPAEKELTEQIEAAESSEGVADESYGTLDESGDETDESNGAADEPDDETGESIASGASDESNEPGAAGGGASGGGSGGSSGTKTLADVDWDVDSAAYDPDEKAKQAFTVSGDVTLPDGIDAGDVTLKAAVSVTAEAAVYTVAFDLNGQSSQTVIPVQKVSHNELVTRPANDPTSESHTFEGWYPSKAGEGNLWNFATDLVTEDITLYAKWKIKTYTISFEQAISTDPAAQNMPSSLTVSHGSIAVKPANPTLEGYSFSGWFTDEACTDAYTWTVPVTKNMTLYAKFADALTAAADALTFAVIQGSPANNPNEQSIITNLSLITSMTAYPGMTISWASDKPSVISTAGAVKRPEKNESDEEVTLTATITLAGKSVTKTFNLIVRKQGTTGVEITDPDPRFAPGYPLVTIDGAGKATLKVKLDPGVASSESPVVVYYAMDGWNVREYWTFNKEGTLFGHLVNLENNEETAHASGPFGEWEITNDEVYSITTDGPLMRDGQPIAVGVVLLANDSLTDSQAVGTVIQLTAEQAGYVDTAPPDIEAAVFNTAGDKIYAYFDEKIINTSLNADDFSLEYIGSAKINSVEVKQDTAERRHYQSWVIVTLDKSIPAEQQANVSLIYTASETNVLEDTNGNKADDGIVWDYIVSAAQRITTYVNPSEGTLCVEYFPAVWWEDMDQNVVTLKKGGTVIPTEIVSWSHDYNGNQSKQFFTFARGQSEDAAYTVAVGQGMNTFAQSPFGPIAARSADEVVPALSTSNVKAFLMSGGNEIELKLPNIPLDGSGSQACNFILTVGGKRLLVRDYHFGDETVWIQLSERQAALVRKGEDVMISYDRTFGGHAPDVHDCLTDVSGAYIPAFGPVSVTVDDGFRRASAQRSLPEEQLRVMTTSDQTYFMEP